MGMAGYTKLFSSILASTIWREDDKTRIVWITLLAMSDKDGIADGSVPGLADFARVSVDDCRAALTKLASPDADSRSKEYEGRRIEIIDGGWRILNHAKYRSKLNEDERREYLRKKQAEHRAKAANVNTASTSVNTGQQTSTPSTHAEADPKADADSKAPKTADKSASPPPAARAASLLPQIQEVFDAWNLTEGLPKCLLISDQRRRSLAVRLKDPFFAANWSAALVRVAASDFARGLTGGTWRVDFDFFIKPNSVAKIMEGKYDNRDAKRTDSWEKNNCSPPIQPKMLNFD